MIPLFLAHFAITNLSLRVKHKVTASLRSIRIELRQKLLQKCLTGISHHKEIPCLATSWWDLNLKSGFLLSFQTPTLSPWLGCFYSGLVPFSMSHSSLMTAHGEQWWSLGHIKTLIISELCKKDRQCQHLTPILSSSFSLSVLSVHIWYKL